MKKIIASLNGGIEVDMTSEEVIIRQAEEISWQQGEDDRYNTSIKEQRREAYIRESDPIYFQSQRGEATEQDWLDKIDEINNRLPYRQ